MMVSPQPKYKGCAGIVFRMGWQSENACMGCISEP